MINRIYIRDSCCPPVCAKVTLAAPNPAIAVPAALAVRAVVTGAISPVNVVAVKVTSPVVLPFRVAVSAAAIVDHLQRKLGLEFQQGSEG